MCGPFEATVSLGKLYTIATVEHYSRHVELIPLGNNYGTSPHRCCIAAPVLSCYGSPAEVLMDRGGNGTRDSTTHVKLYDLDRASLLLSADAWH
jgi:hypothetical protein